MPSPLSRLLALGLIASAASAQSIPPRGDAATFDVGTWNIQQFGDPAPSTAPDAAQMRNAVALLSQSGIDLWAVQEITTEEVWQALLSRLQGSGYAGVLSPEPTFGNFKIGFIYNTTVVSVITAQRPLPTTGSFGGHQPFELHARVTVGGEQRTLRMFAFHAKPFNSEESHNLRTEGARKIKVYTDSRIAQGESVILLGDFNDFLGRARWRGATASPYAPFVEDPDYVAASLAIENAGIPTTCGADDYPACTTGNTIDHIVYTANFPAQLVEVGRYDEALNAIPNFFAAASDHAPVLARFNFGAPVASEGEPEPTARLLPPAPNPFRSATNVRFSLGAASAVRLEVFDVLGRSVFKVERSFGAGEHAVALDGRTFAPGLYVVRLSAGDAVRSSVIVRAD